MFSHLPCTRGEVLRGVTRCSHEAGRACVGVCWCFTAAWAPCRAGRDATGLQLHYCWVHKESSSSGVSVKVLLLHQPEQPGGK